VTDTFEAARREHLAAMLNYKNFADSAKHASEAWVRCLETLDAVVAAAVQRALRQAIAVADERHRTWLQGHENDELWPERAWAADQISVMLHGLLELGHVPGQHGEASR